MSQLELVVALVGIGLVLLTGRTALPSLVLRVRPARMRCWFLDPEREGIILRASPALVDCLERLKKLHYFLLGVKIEKLPLWGQEFREVALAARDHSAFASIVLQPFGAPASVYLYTPLRGGGLVFTRDYAGGMQVEGAEISVKNVPTEDLELLVQDHRQRVDAMRGRGAVLEVRPSQAGSLEATRYFYATSYFRRASKAYTLPALLRFGASVGFLLWAIFAPFLN